MKNKETHKVFKSQFRQDFIESGGYDGRFRSKTVSNKKKYNRKKDKKNYEENY
jgi:hypothetical protein